MFDLRWSSPLHQKKGTYLLEVEIGRAGVYLYRIYSCDCKDAASINQMSGYERNHGKLVAVGARIVRGNGRSQVKTWSQDHNRLQPKA